MDILGYRQRTFNFGGLADSSTVVLVSKTIILISLSLSLVKEKGSAFIKVVLMSTSGSTSRNTVDERMVNAYRYGALTPVFFCTEELDRVSYRSLSSVADKNVVVPEIENVCG